MEIYLACPRRKEGHVEAAPRTVLEEGWGEKMLKRALQHCLRVSRLGNRGCGCVRSASSAAREGGGEIS